MNAHPLFLIAVPYKIQGENDQIAPSQSLHENKHPPSLTVFVLWSHAVRELGVNKMKNHRHVSPTMELIVRDIALKYVGLRIPFVYAFEDIISCTKTHVAVSKLLNQSFQNASLTPAFYGIKGCNGNPPRLWISHFESST